MKAISLWQPWASLIMMGEKRSTWFKPYAAGWYAWKYEGHEITRAEAEADQDRLLALERLA